MKRVLLIGTVVLAGLCITAQTAHAGGRGRWGFGFGFGHGGPYVRGGYSSGHHGRHYRRGRHYRHQRHHHVHSRAPIYDRVWVEPTYHTVHRGYDSCGRPIYRNVIVRRGYYDRSLIGYRCRTCGVRC